jgi:hypothetical protein
MINVVYHCTAVGNWRDVVVEQFDSLKKCGLTCIYATHIGEDVSWFQEQALRQGIDMRLAHHFDSLDHPHYHALKGVEYLAKTSSRPILYFHTKGVRHYDAHGRGSWRKLMQRHVVENWRENLKLLKNYDVVGVNWLTCDSQAWIGNPAWKRPHYPGNFWISKPEWIKKLPLFDPFYQKMAGLACQVWIGAGQGCKAHSLVCSDKPFWESHFDWSRLEMPRFWGDL